MLRLTLPIEALKIIDLIPDWPQADGVLVVQSTRSITLTWRDTGALFRINAARNAAADNKTLLCKLAKKHSGNSTDSLKVRMANWAEWLRNGLKIIQSETGSVN
jgi:hypothetical protein